MTEKHKKELPHQENIKQNNGHGVVILLLIGIIGLGSYLLIESNPEWMDAVFSKPKLEDTVHKEPVTDEAAIQEIQEQKNADKEASRVKDYIPDDSEELNPYNKTENEADPQDNSNNLVNDKVLISDLDDYRVYLANANLLILKFMNNVNYSDNLDVIRTLEFPNKIEEIVVMLESYNNMIQNNEVESEKISLFNSDIFEKFLKIRKETQSSLGMKKLKSKIESKLDYFSEYIFSSQLQKDFLWEDK